MSVLNPESAWEYIIRQNKVRELLMRSEIGEKTMKEINAKVAQMLLQAQDRSKGNGRKRIYPCDL